ncbi:hypothetical protein OPQ81_002939 [Rhizoctonia solani]|nr:hypothetical protein OPQ81_002939 [Rhizoctonia solani]
MQTVEEGNIFQSNKLKYLASVMHECLVEHGCPDLGPLVDPHGFSSSAVAEGGFGDIWAGRHQDGTKLGIKALRFTLVTDDMAKKQLK